MRVRLVFGRAFPRVGLGVEEGFFRSGANRQPSRSGARRRATRAARGDGAPERHGARHAARRRDGATASRDGSFVTTRRFWSVGRSVGRRAVERSSGTVTPPSAGGVFALTRDGDGARSRAMRCFRIKRWDLRRSMWVCRPRSTSSSSRRRLDVRRAERGQHDGQHDDGVDEARGERDDDEGCELCEEDDGTSEQACRGGDG